MENLRVNRNGYLEGETHRQCTRCGSIFEKRKPNCLMTVCKLCNSTRIKSQSVEVKMWHRAKNRAKDKGIPFNITVDDIVIPELCPVLGIPMKSHAGKSGAYADSPSLDRKIPELGYTKGNIQVMSHLANQMKAFASSEQLLQFAKWIIKTYS